MIEDAMYLIMSAAYQCITLKNLTIFSYRPVHLATIFRVIPDFYLTEQSERKSFKAVSQIDRGPTRFSLAGGLTNFHLYSNIQ